LLLSVRRRRARAAQVGQHDRLRKVGRGPPRCQPVVRGRGFRCRKPERDGANRKSRTHA